MKKAERGKYRITKNQEISPGIFELWVCAPEIAAAGNAGQFVNVYLPDKDKLLPRPLSIADAHGETLVLVYAVVGKGTEAMASLGVDEMVTVMGPLGTGFFDCDKSIIEEDKKVILIGGGVGIPPLHFAAKNLRGKFQSRIKIEAMLGFREEPWYVTEFESVCDAVHVISETEGEAQHTGNVVELLDRQSRVVADASRNDGEALVLSCGPRAMLEAVSGWCTERNLPLRVSLEERMGCGFGACAGCSINIRTQGGESVRKKVCVDGPVFWADEVIW